MSLNKYLNDNKVELFFLIYKIFNLAFMNRWGHCLLNLVGFFCKFKNYFYIVLNKNGKIY